MFDYCYACGVKPKEKRYFNSKKGLQKDLATIFNLYSKIDITTEHEFDNVYLCRNCHDRLINLHENATAFRKLCEQTQYKSRPFTAVPLIDNDITTCTYISDSPIENGTSNNVRSFIVSPETPDNSSNISSKPSCSTDFADHNYSVKKQKPISKKLKIDKSCNRQLFPPLCEHDHTYYTGSIKEKDVFSYPDIVKNFFDTVQDDENCLRLRETVSSMNNRSKGFVSCLMNKKVKDMEHFNWEKIVNEFQNMLPQLFKLITSAMMPRNQEPRKMIDLFPRLGMVYAIIMQGRHPGLSLVQRIVSMLLMDNICDQKVK